MPEPISINEATCRHHWVIEMPNGPVSQGRCRLCSQVRDFFNDPDQALRQPVSAQPAA